MSGADFVYNTDQSLPPLGFAWKSYDKQLIDFSNGWVFTFQLVSMDGLVATTQTTGIVGSAGSPNVIVTPNVSWWTGLEGRYLILLKATNVGGASRIFRVENPPTIDVVTAPV